MRAAVESIIVWVLPAGDAALVCVALRQVPADAELIRYPFLSDDLDDHFGCQEVCLETGSRGVECHPAATRATS